MTREFVASLQAASIPVAKLKPDWLWAETLVIGVPFQGWHLKVRKLGECFGRRVNIIVIGEFSYGEPISPIILSVIDVEMKVNLNFLIGVFWLSICLKVISHRRSALDPEDTVRTSIKEERKCGSWSLPMEHGKLKSLNQLSLNRHAKPSEEIAIFVGISVATTTTTLLVANNIRAYVSRCLACQAYKPHRYKTKAPLHSLPVIPTLSRISPSTS